MNLQVILSILFLLAYYFKVVDGKKTNRLLENLMKDYDIDAPPIKGTGMHVNITVHIYPFFIHKFDASEEILSIGLGVHFGWNDKNLRWDPEGYDGITKYPVSTEKIWLPKLLLTNSVENMGLFGGTSSHEATVSNDGNVTWFVVDIFRVICEGQNYLFPYDIQSCSVNFTGTGLPFESAHLDLNSNSKPALDYFHENSYWELVNHRQSISKNGYSQTIQYIIIIKRNDFSITNVIVLPTLALLFANPCVFKLPVMDGERVTFATTLLVSISLLITMVASEVPTSSSSVCFFLYLMNLMTANSIIIVCGTIKILHARRTAEKEGTEDKSEKLNKYFFYGTLSFAVFIFVCFFIILWTSKIILEINK